MNTDGFDMDEVLGLLEGVADGECELDMLPALVEKALMLWYDASKELMRLAGNEREMARRGIQPLPVDYWERLAEMNAGTMIGTGSVTGEVFAAQYNISVRPANPLRYTDSAELGAMSEGVE